MNIIPLFPADLSTIWFGFSFILYKNSFEIEDHNFLIFNFFAYNTNMTVYLILKLNISGKYQVAY